MQASDTLSDAGNDLEGALNDLARVYILGRLEGPYQDEDAREWEKAVGYHLFSPTQISTFIECPRKWAWRRIAKIYTPANASAALGTRVHKVLEDYLRDGTRPDFVKDRVAAEIASSGLHFLPEPKTPGMVLEEEFRFQSPRTSFVYHGFKDVSLPPGIPLPALGFDGSVPIVKDHKTTKSISDWAKTEDDLRFDTQSCLYAYDAMWRFQAPAADLAWLYYQTEGARRASPTTIRLTSREAAPVFDAIERVAEEAASALDKKLQPLDLPPNVNACGAYGGCPYRHTHCTDLNKPSQILRSRIVSNNLIADLRARVQGTASAAPPTITEKPPEEKTYLVERGEQKFVGKGSTIEEAKADSLKQAEDATVTAPAVPSSGETVKVNPPEGDIPPTPQETKAEEPKEEKKPRSRKAKAETPAATTKDPLGADAAMHTGIDEKKDVVESAGADKAQASGAITSAIEGMKQELESVIASTITARTGFTLYVDCIPIGRPAKAASRLIANAQERMLVDGPRDQAGNPVPDYRLVDYGKGAPAFVSFVLDQVDGTFDLTLDTRSPEGAVLLEPLMARAAFVVRGLR